MNICVVTNDYPDSKRAVYPFVKNLVEQFGAQGQQITVIAPFSITHNLGLKRFEELPHNQSINILRPLVCTFSNIRLLGFSPSRWIHKNGIMRELRKLKTKPDVIYCHFWGEVFSVYDYAKENRIPVVVASGESVIPKYLSEEPYRTICNYVSKVVCVSSKNKNESISLGLTTEEKCRVFPNAIDNSLFRVSNQSDLKKSLGIKDTDFVLAYVGWFINRKGSLRVAKAIENLADDRIKIIFIGKGPEEPHCNGIIFKGSLPHDEIPRYLNCADAFILPTLAEGCCNAVIEAMACGLPVISSDKEFNWDVLNDNNSLLIDPENVDAIADAITELRDNVIRRKQLSDEAIKTAAKLTIEERARKIIEFVED